jgi:hypothetical protein
MAINVNTVYTTVLSILNKEQRGYMTPDEFNKVGTQVQLEMFEKYFEDLNQQLRVPLQAAQMDAEYADRIKTTEEKISIFQVNNGLLFANGSWSLAVGDPAIHRIGSIQYEPSGYLPVEIQRLTQKEYNLVQRSKLTAPTEKWPVYKEEGDLFYIYPSTIQAKGTVMAYYIKKPSDVVWGFTPGSLGQYTYSSAASTDFELDAIEQTEVILNILMYAGVIIRDPQIVQTAASMVQQDEVNQKS